ncbi:MAG: SH3 domain-containing protein, partial [Anaerolineae bacterium]|nr:SH3 domain-containing protein [Anaerolineae bacterium]
MRKFQTWPILILLLVTGMPVLAQLDSCAAIVQAAVESALLECSGIETGEVCYGNADVTIETDDFVTFSRPGDRIAFAETASVQTTPMNIDSGAWGLALLKVQANAPEQVLTYVVFGDVTLEDASEADEPVNTAFVRVRSNTGANVRAEPTEDAALVTQLLSGDVVMATGQLADGSWLRLRLPGEADAWVYADLMRGVSDLEMLPSVTADDEPLTNFYSPMQAFTFQSGVYSAICGAAPESGLLLQTPDAVEVLANGVPIAFDGTIYLQAAAGSEMIVTVVEGSASVSSADVTQTVDAGELVTLPLADEESYAAPQEPEEYAYVDVRELPFALLPNPVEDLEFNLLNVIIPAPRSGGPLDGLNADSACTIAAVNEVRLRQGPGREYPISARLLPNESARPDARAESTDGALWWRLTDGF